MTFRIIPAVSIVFFAMSSYAFADSNTPSTSAEATAVAGEAAATTSESGVTLDVTPRVENGEVKMDLSTEITPSDTSTTISDDGAVGSSLGAKQLRVPANVSDHEAVNDLDLSIEPGDLAGLSSPSGAGKTTVTRSLMLFIEPTRRYISAGRMIDPEIEALRQELAEQAVMFADGGLPGDQVAVNADIIAGLAIRPTRLLSGAARQRVAIGRALINEPDIILMDEPFAYEPTYVLDIDALMQAIEASKYRDVGSLSHVYAPADDVTDPNAASSSAAHLDSETILSDEVAKKGIHPAQDPLKGDGGNAPVFPKASIPGASDMQVDEFAGKSLDMLKLEQAVCQMQDMTEKLNAEYGDDQAKGDVRPEGSKAYCQRLAARIGQMETQASEP